jgi:leucyl aminopeptidase (aminopeptidase T)
MKPYDTVVKKCLALKSYESCLVVTDKNKTGIAKSLFDAAARITSKTTLILTHVGKNDGEEPTHYIAKEMKKYDVIILATTRSLTHTKARRDATRKGARIASMPNITEHAMRCIDVDYKRMHRSGAKLAGILSKANSVRVTTPAGTDLEMSLRGVYIDLSDGLFAEKGSYGNLPDGEVCMMPVFGTANGIFIVDGSILNRKVDKLVRIEVEDGFATRITGGRSAAELVRLLREHGRDAHNIAELGIGINPKAMITGNILEDEKAIGTAHIALGNNVSFGGKINVPLHVDGVMKNPTIYADGKVIVKAGRI